MDGRKSSVSELSKRFSEQKSSNTKDSERQKELAEIAEARRLAANQTPDEQPAEPIKSNIIPELTSRGSVASLRNQASRSSLFSSEVSSQRAQINADMVALRSSNLNILRIAKALEEQLTERSKQALTVVKDNETSKQAEIKLDTKQLVEFKQIQANVLEILDVRIQQECKQFAAISKEHKSLTKDRFLELCFALRSYQVCLEQDILRHAARRVDSKSSSAPSELAIVSLNYYQDFFKNLADIEKIWPEAGKEIRTLEIADLFANKLCKDSVLFQQMLDKKTYESAYAQFNGLVGKQIDSNQTFKTYVQSGDGLDMKNHPWTLNGLKRIAQANSSINFKQIIATDDAHENALKKVDERVETDTKKFSF